MLRIGIIIITAMVTAGAIAYQQIFNSVATLAVTKKEVAWAQSLQATAANDFFWRQFHAGNYDSIPLITDQLTAAYVSNPNDIRTINHLAFTHMWALSERQNGDGGASVIEHATLAQKYFGESYLMNPKDTRILSFLSSAKMVNGAIAGDRGLVKEGYLNGLKAIREWENFSAFSLAYTLSRLPHTDDKFKNALERMKTLAARHVDYFDPDSPLTQHQIATIELLLDSDQSNNADQSTGADHLRYFAQSKYSDRSAESLELKNRVFRNSWIAPHNLEGFFMAYGDMLVKSGSWEEAISVYKLCRHVRQYPDWPYKDVLERRIVYARRNVEVFRKSVKRAERIGPDDAMLVETGIACRSCHQMSVSDREQPFKGYDYRRLMDKKFYYLE